MALAERSNRQGWRPRPPPIFTVAELLSTPPLSRARLLTDAEGTANRIVQHTSVQEVPLQDFVRPHELVMTTGMGLGDDEHGFVAFVAAVARAQAAALAVAIGYHLESVPEIAVDKARQTGLPLIELPWDLRFSEVTELVLERVIETQHHMLKQSDRLRDLFTEIVLGGGSLSDLMESLGGLIGLPVAIENRWGERVGHPVTAFQGVPANPVRVPVRAGSRILGSLIAEESNDPAWTNLALAQGATAAALVLLIQEAKDEARARDASEFASALFNRWFESDGDLGHWAKRLGIDPKGRFIVAVGSFRWPDDRRDEEESAAARWAVDRALTGRHRRSLAIWQGSEVAVLIPYSGTARAEVVNGLADETAEHLRKWRTGSKATWGVSRLANGLSEVADRYRDARIAHGLGSNSSNRTVDYEQLGASPVLFEALSAPEVAHALAELETRYLGPVIDAERHTGLELTRTLEAFFDENGNVSATARLLRLNRQSLIYRLQKIETLLQLRLDEASARFAVEVAFRSWKLRNAAVHVSPQRLGARRASGEPPGPAQQ